MRPYHAIKLLAENSSRLDKIAILEQVRDSGDTEFFEGAILALDKTVTFGIKQLPEALFDGAGMDYSQFTDLADQLASRVLTGHAARDAVQDFCNQCTVDQWNNWYRLILSKNLKCGVTDKTINKVAPANLQIPMFGCQLAHDGANHEKKITGVKQIEIKLDGVRVLAVIKNKKCTLYSRNGLELTNFGHIQEQLEKADIDDTVLDGEVMSGEFQNLMKNLQRKTDAHTEDAVLHLFDWLPLHDFEQGACSSTQADRTVSLETWVNDNAGLLTHCEFVPYQTVDLSTPQGQQQFAQINKTAIDNGYEGIMIKDPKAPYECKRSYAWLKIKPVIELSLPIVAVEEGTGKYQGMMGAIVCSGEDDGKTVTVNVGSGFSDEQREQYWQHRNQLFGVLAEVKADAVTQNQDGTYSLRFPRFKTLRGFTAGEKL